VKNGDTENIEASYACAHADVHSECILFRQAHIVHTCYFIPMYHILCYKRQKRAMHRQKQKREKKSTELA